MIQPDDRPNSIARLFQLPVLRGGLQRHATNEAELCRTPRLQKVQDEGLSLVRQELEGAR